MKKNRRAVIIAFFVALVVFLPSYDKYWAPYDEGNYTISAKMATEGMVPYKDFLLVMYPPGYVYALAALYKIFGASLLVGRIYNIILLSVICAAIFYIARKVTSAKYALLAFIAGLSVLTAWGEPPIPRPIWPGVTLSMLSAGCIIAYIEYGKQRFFILSSMFTGLCILFRHDVGALTFLAVLIGLSVYTIYISRNERRVAFKILKSAFRLSLLYSILPFLFISALAVWLYRVNALEEAKTALFALPASFGKWAHIPFPEFCWNFNMIFHRGCLFIRQNKFYLPVIICAASAVFFIAEVLTKKRPDKKIVFLSVLLPFGIFYLQQLIFRTDGNHLAVSFGPSAILFAALFTYKHDARWKIFGIFKILLIAYTSLLMILFFYRNTEKYIKDIVVKPYIKKSIEPVRFSRGTIYIPDDVRDTFVSLSEYVDGNTEKGEKIYVGHLRHDVPQMGWFDLLYFVTDRTPGVKQHVMIPGFQSRPDVQRDMANSLEENNVRVILLRDSGNVDTMGPLDKFIRDNYKLEQMIDSYHVYVKR